MLNMSEKGRAITILWYLISGAAAAAISGLIGAAITVGAWLGFLYIATEGCVACTSESAILLAIYLFTPAGFVVGAAIGLFIGPAILFARRRRQPPP